MLCQGSPYCASGPRDTLRFKGQLLAQLSRCVPVPPARFFPGQEALQCGERGEQAGAGAVRGGNSLLFRCLQNVLTPCCPRGSGAAGRGEGTGDKERQLCSLEPLHQPGSSHLVRWATTSPARPGTCPAAMGAVAGVAGLAPELLPHPVPKGWCAAGGHMVPLTLSVALPAPCAQCGQSR